MWNYKGTSKFGVDAHYGMLEYDFFAIGTEDEFWSLINFYDTLWQRFGYVLEGYSATKNNTELSPRVRAKMKEHRANLCLTFMEEDYKENNIQIREMIVNEQKNDGSYDTIFFYFYLLELSDVKKFVAQASAFSELGFHNAAIAHYSEAIRLVPKGAALYAYRGGEYMKKGKFDFAIKDFNKAIKNDATYVNAYLGRSFAHAKTGNYDAGIADCTQAIQLDPENGSAYTNRGVMYGDKKCFDEAIIDCSKAIELDPENDLNYTNRGTVYQKKGDFDKARADFQKALKISPGNLTAKEGVETLGKIIAKIKRK
jgi:tetratricopeptide (TPR) repeat protein